MWLYALGSAYVFGALYVLGEFVVAPMVREPATTPTFDEHAATATALLRPDDPTLPEPMTFAEQVEMWLELHTAKES